MNNPMNPNKLTAVIMIVLGFALLFIMGAVYQSYQNGIVGIKILQLSAHNINMTQDAVIYLKTVAMKSNVTSQNQVIFIKMVSQLDELNNKTDALIKKLETK